MNCSKRWAGLLFVVIVACFAVTAPAQPQTVPWKADNALDEAAYVTLAKEWKAYIEANGETAQALLNLGRAYEYSGEQQAAMAAARRAFELEPDMPEVLFYYGKLLYFHDDHNREEALRYLRRCRDIDPGYGRNLTMLATAYELEGDLKRAEEMFRSVHQQNIMPRLLQDLAYNMLVGLPPGAVLITNGDNDTFPLLALQAGMDFRTDVVVLNRHLLNTGNFRKTFFELYPALAPHNLQELEASLQPAPAIIKKMIEERKTPIYLAVTVSLADLGMEDPSCVEGLGLCITGAHLTPEESARLFLDTYRLDSTTDWSFAWDLKTGLRHLVANYVVCMYRIAEQKGVTPETRRLLIQKAMNIAEFHHMDRMIMALRSLEKR